jgi:hypothetical protein
MPWSPATSAAGIRASKLAIGPSPLTLIGYACSPELSVRTISALSLACAGILSLPPTTMWSPSLRCECAAAQCPATRTWIEPVCAGTERTSVPSASSTDSARSCWAGSNENRIRRRRTPPARTLM